MNEFLTNNAKTILIIIKFFLIAYAIFTTLGVIRRIIKHINEKGLKKSIGYMIYNIIGAVIFFVALFFIFYLSDILLAYSGL